MSTTNPSADWTIADQIAAQRDHQAALALDHTVRTLAHHHGAPPATADALATQARAAFPILHARPRHPHGITLEDWVPARLRAIAAAAPDPAIALATPNPFDRATWNLTRQMLLQKQNPAVAARLKAAAQTP